MLEAKQQDKIITLDKKFVDKIRSIHSGINQELNKPQLKLPNVYIKGGAARLALLIYAGVEKAKEEPIRDSDFAFIGNYENYRKIDHSEYKDIDEEGLNLQQYFATRDVTANEVIMDQNNLIFTRRALRDAKKQTINPKYHIISSRLSSRAILFSIRYNMTISDNITLTNDYPFDYLVVLLKAYQLRIERKFYLKVRELGLDYDTESLSDYLIYLMSEVFDFQLGEDRVKLILNDFLSNPNSNKLIQKYPEIKNHLQDINQQEQKYKSKFQNYQNYTDKYSNKIKTIKPNRKNYNLQENAIKSLLETDLSLHYGKVDNIDINRPYVSDPVGMIGGRDTGHFGSGTYFSTYQNQDYEIKDTLPNYENSSKNRPTKDNPVIKIGRNVMVTDLDLYNLYKPKNTKEARLLYDTLQTINGFSASIYTSNEPISVREKIAKKQLSQIDANLPQLNLKRPSLREFINILKEVRKEISSQSGPKNQASISTRFMEYNGYNGVNVNGIDEFDNTTHGSVVYNLSKTKNKTDNTTTTTNNNNSIQQNIANDIKDTNKYGIFKFNNQYTKKTLNFYFNNIEKLINIDDITKELYKHDINPDVHQHILNIYPKYLARITKEHDSKNINDKTIDFLIKNNKIEIILNLNNPNLNQEISRNKKAVQTLIDNNTLKNYIHHNNDFMEEAITNPNALKYVIDNNLLKHFNQNPEQISNTVYTLYDEFDYLTPEQKNKAKEYVKNINPDDLMDFVDKSIVQKILQ